MRIAITGASGFIGRHLTSTLRRDGHQIIALGRADLGSRTEHLAERIQGCKAIINLAGETINHRWSRSYKQRIYNSRVETTRKLVKAIAKLQQRPGIFISTSAIGAFDANGCYVESDKPNAKDFLGKVSRDWEEAALAATASGVRTLIFRFALVLGHDGGIIKQLLPIFSMGLGGPVGSGQQPFSWVHIDDLTSCYQHALKQPSMEGIYHISAPNPDTNLGMTKVLGRVLNRPAVIPVPKLLLKLIFGEGADVMTSGQCVTSERLVQSGFVFKYPELEPSLNAVVAKPLIVDASEIRSS